MRSATALLILALAVLAPRASGTTSAGSSTPAIRVEMTEFAFRPSVIHLSAGIPTTIEFINRGQLAHQFDAPILRRAPVSVLNDSMQVEATGLEFVRVQPGKRTTIRIILRTRGRFPFSCTIEGHAEAGMVGVLEVR